MSGPPTGRRRPGTAGADPLGKLALFSGAAGAAPGDGPSPAAVTTGAGPGDRRRPGRDGTADPFAPAPSSGRRALFSDAPVGRRALFSDAPVGRHVVFSDAPVGRHAVSSDAPAGPPHEDASRRAGGPGPTFSLVCRSCRARTALGLVGLAARLVPSLWLPGRRWSRYARCPACGHPAWCRIERTA